jgi:hypothetical protein
MARGYVHRDLLFNSRLHLDPLVGGALAYRALPARVVFPPKRDR